ncbi:MAG: efflux RND transporter periplasmic adaptor subunit [Verrucomicrobia bacterium]|nr:efflux RND transporter periplasmic adaptor subunit [Verrucomicrobiota bacterium]
MKFKFAILTLALLTFSTGCEKKPSAAKPSASGTIESDEVRVASRYGGRVEKLHAQEGDALKTGDPIVDLDAAELRARREQSVAWLAELEAGPRKEEIAAARNELESLKADLQFAAIEKKRAEDLLKSDVGTVAERDRAVARFNSLEKSAAAAQSKLDLLLAGTRPEKLAQARAQLAEMDAQLKEMKICAPGDCTLEVLSVKVGDVLAPNREIATLLLPNPLWVRVFVPEPWLGHIKVGDKVTVETDAFPKQPFQGTVVQLARAAEFTPRNVQTVEDRIKQVFGVKVRLDNAAGKLRAGMSADVMFPNVPR